MDAPGRMSPEVKGVIDKVYTERGKELKEAAPMPFEIVAALQRFVVECFDHNNEALGVFTWWVLILIFASLRWDDGRHVSPQWSSMMTLCSEWCGRQRSTESGEGPGLPSLTVRCQDLNG